MSETRPPVEFEGRETDQVLGIFERHPLAFNDLSWRIPMHRTGGLYESERNWAIVLGSTMPDLMPSSKSRQQLVFELRGLELGGKVDPRTVDELASKNAKGLAILDEYLVHPRLINHNHQLGKPDYDLGDSRLVISKPIKLFWVACRLGAMIEANQDISDETLNESWRQIESGYRLLELGIDEVAKLAGVFDNIRPARAAAIAARIDRKIAVKNVLW